MGKLITIFWRDIPSQVVAKRGRESVIARLSPRFHAAIDRAAMRAGKGSSEAYFADWRREPQGCGDDLPQAVRQQAEHLESQYSDERLERLVRARGLAETEV